ncbi:hypothetical protein D8I24_2192 (plasmid) [Cupriavidus necator H850]|jgi:hypothetical protein|nr:hypothetical protein D8I24_2192 [Cupriavidus necator H850]
MRRTSPSNAVRDPSRTGVVFLQGDEFQKSAGLAARDAPIRHAE